MDKDRTESSSILNRLRDSKAIRTFIGIGAISFVAACGPQESNNTPPNATQSQEATPSPTETTQAPEQISASGEEAIKKISTYSIKEGEKVTGKKLEKTIPYLESSTDILQGTETAYYNSAIYTGDYDENKSALENGLQDAIASELLVYLTGTPAQVQELLDRKQLTVQDVVYLYEEYEKLVPKLQSVEQEANESVGNPKLVLTEAPMIHGIVAKSESSLLAIARIAELYQEDKITLLDSDSCEYDPSKDYTNDTFKLEQGDGFILINPQQDPSESSLFTSDRFNPFYSNMSTVGTFGIISTKRSQQCENNIPLSAEKMLLPYYANLKALSALAKIDFRIANYPALAKVEYKLYTDVLGLNPDTYVTTNKYKEN